MHLTGTVTDASGKQHAVQASIDDLPAWREALHKSRERYEAPVERRWAKAFGDSADRRTKAITDHLSELARSGGRPYSTAQDPESDWSSVERPPSTAPTTPAARPGRVILPWVQRLRRWLSGWAGSAS